jgi:uncharacterized membrane protein (UPF0127 family)
MIPTMRRSQLIVRVENVTRGEIVGRRIRVASSMRDRTVGLLRTPALEPGEGLWIENAPSIHMFFMRYAIDAVFTDAGGRVTKVVPNLKPWRVVWWARGARDCLELPVGAAAAAQIEVGDQLERTPTAS